MQRTAWKLTKAQYATTAFTGYGAMLHAGRWHTQGTPLVYAADSLELALLEVLVHVNAIDLLAFSYVGIPIEFDDNLLIRLSRSHVPSDWNHWPWPTSTQQIGTQWFYEKQSAILQVPSTVVSTAFNYLINPAHPKFSRVRIGPPQSFSVDPRLASTRTSKGT